MAKGLPTGLTQALQGLVNIEARQWLQGLRRQLIQFGQLAQEAVLVTFGGLRQLPQLPGQIVDSLLKKRYHYLGPVYSRPKSGSSEKFIETLLLKAQEHPVHLLAAGEKAAMLGIFATRRLLYRGPAATVFFWNKPNGATSYLWEKSGAKVFFPGHMAEQTLSPTNHEPSVQKPPSQPELPANPEPLGANEKQALQQQIELFANGSLALRPGMYFHFTSATLRQLAPHQQPPPAVGGNARRGDWRRLWALWQHFWHQRTTQVWTIDWHSHQVLFRRAADHVEPAFFWPGQTGRVVIQPVGPLGTRPAWVHGLEKLEGAV